MKILVVTPRYYPEQFSITKICEEFVKMGHEVTVVTGQPNYGYGQIVDGYENVFEETINGVCVRRIKEHPRKKGHMNLLLNYYSIYKNYEKFFKKFSQKFDVVISHNLSPIFTLRAASFYTKKYNIPHVHYGLDLWPESLVASGYFKRNSFIYKTMIKRCKKWYSTCDYITFGSSCAEKYFREILKVDSLNFRHIYQPCLTTPPDEKLIRDHHYFNGNRVNILYCGTVANFHRMDYLAKAAKELVDEGFNNFIINIVGSGSKLDSLKQYIKDYKLDDVFSFHGRLAADKTKEHYLSADVLYAPLENNSFTSRMIPQKVIEYLMYGKPIIGMLIGDGKEILESASKGNIIVNEDPKEIAAAIKALFSMSPDDVSKKGLMNRLFFDSNPSFRLESVCKNIIDVCKETIDKKQYN